MNTTEEIRKSMSRHNSHASKKKMKNKEHMQGLSQDFGLRVKT